jgi:hypothetical protein
MPGIFTGNGTHTARATTMFGTSLIEMEDSRRGQVDLGTALKPSTIRKLRNTLEMGTIEIVVIDGQLFRGNRR